MATMTNRYKVIFCSLALICSGCGSRQVKSVDSSYMSATFVDRQIASLTEQIESANLKIAKFEDADIPDKERKIQLVKEDILVLNSQKSRLEFQKNQLLESN